MSKKETKTKSLAMEVIRNVTTMLVIINLVVIGNIAYWINFSIEKSEKQYMAEVIARLTGEVNQQLRRYTDSILGMSSNAVIKEYLKSSEQIGIVPSDYDELARAELQVIARAFGDSVLHILVGSVQSNNLIDHIGASGGLGFSLSSAPYYEAISMNKMVITDAYTDTSTGQTIVTIANPVVDENGVVIGLVGLDILVAKLGDFLSNSSFGESGTTFLLDKNDTLLVYPDSVYVSGDVGATVFKGEDLLEELANPSGEIIRYTSGDVERMGGICLVEQAEWKLVSAMDVADFKQRANLIVGALTGMQLVFGAVGIFLSGRFIHRKLTPIRLIQNYMHEISEGNLQTTLDYESEDEMGALVKDIQGMSSTLFRYINHISETIHDFAEGKIQVSNKVEYTGDFLPVHESMIDFVTLMSGSLVDLKRSVTEVTSGAEQISSGANILANGSQEQAASVEELNALISHVNDEIKETANYSGKISVFAGSITGDILKNNEKMKDLAVNVQEIKNHSNEVKRIIKAIEEVAFQTNILALNAAVEAARAGESGKGFAVVADEVRNLSLKTSEAVQDTTRIITEMAIFVESSTDLAHETSHDLQQIAEASQGFVDNMASITHSTNDQSNAITEIHSGIEQISKVVFQNSAISEESAAATEQLTHQTKRMTEQIQKFKLK